MTAYVLPRPNQPAVSLCIYNEEQNSKYSGRVAGPTLGVYERIEPEFSRPRRKNFEPDCKGEGVPSEVRKIEQLPG